MLLLQVNLAPCCMVPFHVMGSRLFPNTYTCVPCVLCQSHKFWSSVTSISLVFNLVFFRKWAENSYCRQQCLPFFWHLTNQGLGQLLSSASKERKTTLNIPFLLIFRMVLEFFFSSCLLCRVPQGSLSSLPLVCETAKEIVIKISEE